MNSTVTPLAFDQRVADLLGEVGLPSADLGAASKANLYGIANDLGIIGLVGLELHGTVGLLRSLAVSPRFRGRGLGSGLLRHAEAVAADHGIDSLYLLTTTADEFFKAHGYAPADRQAAPVEIAATRQFAGLCPASSAFMVKRHLAQRLHAAWRDR